MKNQKSEKSLISPFFVFFLIQGNMIGVGILNFQRSLIDHAGYNAWISVIVGGVTIHIILWMIYRMFSSDQEILDLTLINKLCFGKALGLLFNLANVLYFYLAGFIVFRVFIEVIQIWMFPVMNIYPICIIFIVIIYYTLAGGLRTLAGISFWGSILPYMIVFPLFFFVLKYLHPINLLPLFNHTFKEIALSTKSMVFQFLGVECLFMVYPFVKTPDKSAKWGHAAVFFVTFIYLIITLITFMYYTEGQLKHIIWPTLTMLKIIEIPIIQRLEYIVVALWFLKVLVSVSISLWVAGRVLRTTLHTKLRWSLLMFLAGFLILFIFFNDRGSVRRLSELYGNIGFYYIYLYIPLLFLITLFKKKRKSAV
ncbi:GerAB/ArcD/ProY family transporter [Paenibacillus prosopidis]|uniref:Spore germination protein (Amino acid permease) n=1 Tax=Paenibacillus prosopidis TaxID=630520 RepID=A0A368W4V5_9BACL|nr:GerAB/ArcD/ProY family transporter [Paenibacillus prosopidis]RCW49461.1 spore germination protein (amino acid permease) [Paenibacillus prosopidis]